MKKCLNCHTAYPSSSSICPSCKKEPENYDGFVSYASKLAHSGGGFKERYFNDIENIEKNHFWFSSRNKLILWALNKYCDDLKSFLEIGCGTGYVLSGVSNAFPNAHLQGSEIFSTGLKFAANRLPDIDFMQMDAREIPFLDEFDVIGIFDVLEHIKEDERVLSQIFFALKKTGLLILTVPQHDWLWSYMDEYACHERRYSRRCLHSKLKKAGFDVIKSTSFVSFLLPLMWVSRFFQRKPEQGKVSDIELRINPWINKALRQIMEIELVAIRKGLNFPLGGSRLVVARKI